VIRIPAAVELFLFVLPCFALVSLKESEFYVFGDTKINSRHPYAFSHLNLCLTLPETELLVAVVVVVFVVVVVVVVFVLSIM
jgi:hypothetical protein